MKMSFLDKYFSTPREANYNDGEMSYANGSSRTEPKRSHQWLNAAEAESSSNKKQAVDAAANMRPISGSSNPDISRWENTPTFQSGLGLFCGHLVGPEPVRTSYLFGKSISSVIGNGEPNREMTGFQAQMRNDSHVHSFGLASNYFAGNNFNKADESFTLMGQTIKMGDGSSMSMGPNQRKENNGISPMRQPLLRGNGNFVPVDHQHGQGDNSISMPPYNSGNEILYASINGHFIAVPVNINKDGDIIIPVGPTRNTGAYNVISMAQTHNRENISGALMGPAYEKGNSSNASMGLNYNMGENNDEVNVAVAAPAATSGTDAAGKKKEKKKSKKNPSNNFPSNVKSLLSAGIFDGVPVKYTSWARDKSLRGIIKEGGYSCGCNDCKFSKAINAYEFERHAGCKTKHPNNHIYFENGKSVYAVVLELQNTPKEMLFEVIQNVTGSPINQKNFSTWKASFQAATHELQQIIGRDGVVIRS